jgi:SAM-dependent MidA family methyltransferase
MSQALAEIIRDEIARCGPMPFRRFMELALYHREHGYYASGRASIGRKGDFFTNVSVGPLFGKLLARQFEEMWENLQRPMEFTIVEQAANDGQFASDVLTALREVATECFARTTYRIVEPFAPLEARQRERLVGLPVTWSRSIEELPSFTGVHFSNELVDAFPVHLVRWNGTQWHEQHVVSADEAFMFTDCGLSDEALVAACGRIPLPLPPGYTTEINLAAADWIREVATRLERGFVLMVDYGHLREDYYSLERHEGTLSAYRQHRRERDPLQDPGETDLTAHVEFSTLMEVGSAAGLRVVGFTDQHHAMVGLGALHFSDGSPSPELRAFQTLMQPTLMGRAFKFLSFTKGECDAALRIFRYTSK